MTIATIILVGLVYALAFGWRPGNGTKERLGAEAARIVAEMKKARTSLTG